MNYPSLQSLCTALIASVSWTDIFSDLLNDSEELAVLAGVEASASSGMLRGVVRSPN